MYYISYIYAKIIKKIRGSAIINSHFDKTVVIYSGSSIYNSTIKKYTYCGYNSFIANTDIGAFCSIADNVYIGGAEHPMSWISTSPVFENVRHSGPSKRFAKINLPTPKRTIIGNDVWIGHNVSIKQGIVIGDGAVIGVGAIVTKDIPPYAIVGGCPAKIIRYRFSPQIIDKLLKQQWWNLDENSLTKIAPFVKEPDIFIKEYDKLEIPNNKKGDTDL